MATLACTPAASIGPVKPQASATRKPATPKPTAKPIGPASGQPSAPPAASIEALLQGKTLRPADAGFVGKVRLAGTLSLLTAGIISDNGGGIISDNGGGIVSNNGGRIISDNGGGFVGKVRFGLLQAAGAKAEAKLADAVVLVEDAAGRVLADATGSPIAAVSDEQGGYVLEAALPAEGLVLRAPLWQGGRLSAMVARDALAAGAAAGGTVPLDLGTSSSIAAAYVLGEYVAPQADPQSTLNKLPATEATRLARDLEAARKGLAAGPTYQDAELRGLGGTLRAQDATVDKTLADIRALLIGQADLGNGRLATEVPLFDVWSLAIDAQGRAYLGEHALGRVRLVGTDGRITTVADAVSGRVRENVPGLSALLPLPDGGLLTTGWALGQIWKLGAAAQAERIAGTGVLTRGPASGAAAAASFLPQALARLPDGTLIVGEASLDEAVDPDATPPRVLAIAPDGALRQLPFGADWTRGRVAGVAAGRDGAIWALHHAAKVGGGRLYRLAPGATAPTLVADGLATFSRSGMALGPDGRAYVCETEGRRLLSFDAAGAQLVVAGPGAPAGAPAIEAPAGVAFGPDGTLWLTDVGTTLVSARDPAGRWTVRAGTTTIVQRGAADALALNFPGSVCFDEAGRMLIAEAGGHKIRRLEGDALTTVAGSFAGLEGDGGPAAAARFDTPLWIRRQGGTLWVMDQNNRRLRTIAPDGTVATVVGPESGKRTVIQPDKPPLATSTEVRWGAGIAFEPGTGRPYWASQFANQVVRLNAKNRVELVVGQPRAEKNEIPPPTAWLEAVPPSGPAAEAPLVLPTGIAFDPTAAEPTLYVADLGHMRIVRITDLDGEPVCETIAGAPATEVLTRSTAAVAAESGVPARTAAVIAPGGLCFDAAGNLYVGELGIRDLPRLAATFQRAFPDVGLMPTFTARVRKIAKDGTITTIAGPGGKFFPDPQAEDALVLPLDLAIDPQGRLVIVDAGANLIRVLPAGSY